MSRTWALVSKTKAQTLNEEHPIYAYARWSRPILNIHQCTSRFTPSQQSPHLAVTTDGRQTDSKEADCSNKFNVPQHIRVFRWWQPETQRPGRSRLTNCFVFSTKTTGKVCQAGHCKRIKSTNFKTELLVEVYLPSTLTSRSPLCPRTSTKYVASWSHVPLANPSPYAVASEPSKISCRIGQPANDKQCKSTKISSPHTTSIATEKSARLLYGSSGGKTLLWQHFWLSFDLWRA